MNATPEKPTGGLPHCPGFLRENLKAFLDGELSPLRRGMVRWHIARCAHCREEAAWLRRLGEDMRTLEKSAPGPNLRRRILASLPPPTPMRPPMKIWRPERAVFRYAPNLALGAAVSAFALGGSYAALSRVAQKETRPAQTPSFSVEMAQSPSANEARIVSAPTTRIDPFAKPSVMDDPTSRRANALYHAAAHRLALQRRREAQIAAAKAPVKVAAAETPLLTLTPNPDAADIPTLRKRLEALAIQAGGAMKSVPMGQTGTPRVAPSVPLESRPAVRSSDPVMAPAMAEPGADASQVAFRIPERQIKPFLQAMRTLGTLKRAPIETTGAKTKNAALSIHENATDQSATRDTMPADTEGFVTFRLLLAPPKP